MAVTVVSGGGSREHPNHEAVGGECNGTGEDNWDTARCAALS